MTKDIKQNTVSPASSGKKRRGASLVAKRDRMGWIFILPFLIGFVFIYAGMIFESIGLAFSQYHSVPAFQGGGYYYTWVGFENFSEVLMQTVDAQGTTHLELIFTSFANQIIDVIIILIFSLFIAVLLNTKMPGRTAFRAIFFLAVVVGVGLLAHVDQTLPIPDDGSGFNTGTVDGAATGGAAAGGSGLVNSMDVEMLLVSLGLGGSLTDTVVELVTRIYEIVNRSGVQMLIFLSGLQGISPSVYESCQMEGATAWETFLKITLPMISPMILVNAFYTIIDSFTAESNEVMTILTTNYFNPSAPPSGQGTAFAWTYFAVVIVMLGIVALICKNFVFYDRKND